MSEDPGEDLGGVLRRIERPPAGAAVEPLTEDQRRVLRAMMARFATGVTVVAARHGPLLAGMTANAIAALHYASDLAPQDLDLRMNSAFAYLADGKTAEARQALIPVAYDPHGAAVAKAAREMMGRIDAGDAEGALAIAGGGEQTQSGTR